MPKEEVRIRKEASRRGITRLCHFTPSRNLSHIAQDPRGVLASSLLSDDEKTVFNPTDKERLDGYTESVCCSIQYPNAWYFRTARDREDLFRDWVVLFIAPHYLWSEETRFCPRNAAALGGSLVSTGVSGFNAMFDQHVQGQQNLYRSANHPEFLPTDEQAEVLIPDNIVPEDILGIAVRDEAQAKRESSALRFVLQGNKPRRFHIVPEFFDPRHLSSMIRNGNLPEEPIFDFQLRNE